MKNKYHPVIWALAISVLVLAGLVIFLLLSPKDGSKEISDSEYGAVFFAKRMYPELDKRIDQAMQDRKITRREYAVIMDETNRLIRERDRSRSRTQ